jgi:tRNA pseudouridine38-40 synthase
VVRYRLILSYNGAAYAGWQRQENALTVQQVVEEALADLLERPVRVLAAGRTDAGVHARGQSVHLDLPRPFPETGLVFGTNHRLPADIRVLAAERMDPPFHAMRSARGKVYAYRLIHGRVLSPLDAPYAVAVEPTLDLGAMQAAAARLPGRHDFAAFTYSGGAYASTRRRIFTAGWSRQGGELRFTLVGEGFLHGMVRALVGTLLEVGRGRRTPEEMAELLTGGYGREAAGPTAPARGLVLERVLYPPPWEGPQ